MEPTIFEENDVVVEQHLYLYDPYPLSERPKQLLHHIINLTSCKLVRGGHYMYGKNDNISPDEIIWIHDTYRWTKDTRVPVFLCHNKMSTYDRVIPYFYSLDALFAHDDNPFYILQISNSPIPLFFLNLFKDNNEIIIKHSSCTLGIPPNHLIQPHSLKDLCIGRCIELNLDMPNEDLENRKNSAFGICRVCRKRWTSNLVTVPYENMHYFKGYWCGCCSESQI
jgi:hypothetical protein